MTSKPQQAVVKFRHLEKRALDLCDCYLNFEKEKRREFALCILDSGNQAVWEWTGGDRELPDDICLRLGELMVGLRACLDVALYEISENERALGHVKPNQITFPCFRRSEQWNDHTLRWLGEEKRQRVLNAQRFADRQKRDVDCVIIGVIASHDKHRGLLELTMGYGSRGVYGAIDSAWASELGLGRRGSDGYFEAFTTHGTPVIMYGRRNVVIEGPLGGLALSGTVPSTAIRYASNLFMDNEDDKERLSRVSVFDSIEQALSEVAEILEIFGGGDERASLPYFELQSDTRIEMLTAMAEEAASIYGRVPQEASERPGWRVHLREVGRHVGDSRGDRLLCRPLRVRVSQTAGTRCKQMRCCHQARQAFERQPGLVHARLGRTDLRPGP